MTKYLLALTLNNGFDTATGSSGAGYSAANTLPVLIGFFISSALSLMGVILLLLVIYAGFLWMTAQGDPKKVDKAQVIMRNAVIGLAIMLSAYALTSFVVTTLSGPSYGTDPNYTSADIWGS